MVRLPYALVVAASMLPLVQGGVRWFRQRGRVLLTGYRIEWFMLALHRSDPRT